MSIAGNKILGKAKASFKERLQNASLSEIEVPEWECIVYFPETVSLQRMDRISKAMGRGGVEHMADIIIEVACDEDGMRLFSSKNASHRNQLMEDVDPAVLMRVAGELSDAIVPKAAEGEFVKEAEKNSEATATS